MHTMLRSPSVALSPAVMIEARLLDVYIPQPEMEAEATLADDCYEIEALLADPADCPEIKADGSPADCPEIEALLADLAVEAGCPEIKADGSPAVEADCPDIEADGSPAVEADCPEIEAGDSPAVEADCPEIEAGDSPVAEADCPEVKLVDTLTDAFIPDPSPLTALVRCEEACPYQATVSERLDALERDTTSVLQMFQRLEPRISLVLSRLELSLAEGSNESAPLEIA